MAISTMFQGDDFKRIVQGTMLGAAATMVLGFGWGGWVLGGTARETAQTTATTAVVKALVPICVEQFQAAPDSGNKLVELKKASSWEQSTYIEKGGWASMPGSKDTNYSGLSQACATALRDLK